MVQKKVPGATKTKAQIAAGKRVAAKRAELTAATVAGSASRKAQAEAPAVTEVGSWKKAKAGFPLQVPSGNVALVRPVGMQAFLTKGIIPNSLREIAMEAISKKKAPELKVEDFDEKQIQDMLDLFDAVTLYCVIEPKVTSVPHWSHEQADAGACSHEDIGEIIPAISEFRDPDLLYVDDVELEDKAFVFQFACGGTRSLEQFREEYTRSVESLSGGEDVGEDSE